MASGVNDFETGTNTGDYDVIAKDTIGNQTTITLTLNETNINEPTTTLPDTNNTNEDIPLIVTAANGVFKNDNDPDDVLEVSTFTVAGNFDGATLTVYNEGDIATITDKGTITLNSDGGYTFTPVTNYSGDIPVVTYTTNTGSTDTLTIDVTAVADAPNLGTSDSLASDGSFLMDQVIVADSVGLTKTVYTNIGQGGAQLPSSTLEALTDSLSGGTTTIVAQPYRDGGNGSDNIASDSVEVVTGLIYLEAGSTISFSGYADDSLHIELGGNTLLSTDSHSYGNYDSTDTAGTKFDAAGLFTVPQSGYYTLETYIYNHSGPGDMSINVTIDGVTTPLSSDDLNVYPNVDAIDNNNGQHSDFVLGSEAGTDGGVYPVEINQGYEGSDIKLSSVSSSLVDIDGSETLSLILSGIPMGSTITDGTNTYTESGIGSLDVLSWDLDKLSLKVPNVDDTTTYTLNVVATTTEALNNDTASTTTSINVTVLDSSPTAISDSDSVGFGGTAYGNVITGEGGLNADTLGADSAELSSVKFGSTTYNFGSNTTIVINGDHGKLTINKDGSYNYESDESNPRDGVSEEFTYYLVDSDGDTSNAVLTVNHDKNLTPTDDTADVYESGLAGGTESSTNKEFVSGNLFDNDNGVGANAKIIEISSDGHKDTKANKSGVLKIDTEFGVIKVYTKDTADNRAGDYEYELTDVTNGDNIVDSIKYKVNDGSGSTSEATLNVNIVDDAPIGSNIYSHLEDLNATTQTTNLVIVLDRSGSMAWDLDGNNSGDSDFDVTQIRMDIAKEALGSMFNSFDNLGNVNIKFVDFSSSVSESAWFSDDVASANSYLDGVNANGGTQYDTALNSVINGYNPPSADKTLLYFISDGEPNNDHGLDNSVTYGGEQGESAWTKFLTDNNVDIAYGIGISNGVSLDSLTPVAFPDTNADGDIDPYAVKVLNEFDLKKTLLDTVSDGVVQGDASVLMSSGSDGIVIGADGGSITQLVYNGVTYNATSGETASVTTTHGGVLDINFTTGEYFYTINSKESISSENDVFKITATDGDGDTKTVDLVITLDFVASLDANRDYIVTNSSAPIDIDSSMLTNNDSGVNTIDSVQNPDTGSVSGTESVTIDGANSFEYTVSKTANGQTLTDIAEVNIAYQTGNTVTGTDKDEIIIGRDGEADILSAGSGDDTIVHDLSDISIDGGSGTDTLILVDDSIDFGVLNNISNIEALDLGEGTDNAKSVSLTLDDITGMTDIDNDLKIFGDDNDSVNLKDLDPSNTNTWIKSDTQSESGFDEYISSDDATVKLQIDDDINVDY